MNNQKISGLTLAFVGACLLLTTGCIDAVTDGLTSGIQDGLSKIIEDFIQALGANL